ncbi:MAG: heat-inducible transcriptional repressor HrcA [Acidimicrobiales bacterium]
MSAKVLDDRKAAILRAVVEEYIQTAQPVGSAAVSRIPGLAVSSATVRNEMGVLEREGYLAQPHTSAGRVPTDKGYRFFVDSLPSAKLDPGQSQQIRTFFATAHGELERMLADTSRFLSGLTDYAGVVVREAGDPARIRSIQVVALAAHAAVIVVVLGSGAVDKRIIEFPDEPGDAQVAAASAHLAAHLTGDTIGHHRLVPSADDPAVDRIVSASVAALANREAELEQHQQVFVGGAARMAAAFDAVSTIRQVLDILEQQFVLVTLIRDVLDRGLSVAIGAEHGVQPLADCSIVIAPYEVEGERAGTVGILGPTRMHYDQALAAVAVVSRRLGQALSDSAERR